MPGLRRTDDRTFVDAMQSINVAIINGWFALSFAGAPCSPPWLQGYSSQAPSDPPSRGSASPSSCTGRHS
jgi:hypothetical protein